MVEVYTAFRLDKEFILCSPDKETAFPTILGMILIIF